MSEGVVTNSFEGVGAKHNGFVSFRESTLKPEIEFSGSLSGFKVLICTDVHSP